MFDIVLGTILLRLYSNLFCGRTVCNYLIRLYFNLTCHDLIQAYLCLRLVWGTTCSDLIQIIFMVGQYTVTKSELTLILLYWTVWTPTCSDLILNLLTLQGSICTYFLRSCSYLIYLIGLSDLQLAKILFQSYKYLR